MIYYRTNSLPPFTREIVSVALQKCGTCLHITHAEERAVLSEQARVPRSSQKANFRKLFTYFFLGQLFIKAS